MNRPGYRHFDSFSAFAQTFFFQILIVTQIGFCQNDSKWTHRTLTTFNTRQSVEYCLFVCRWFALVTYSGNWKHWWRKTSRSQGKPVFRNLIKRDANKKVWRNGQTSSVDERNEQMPVGVDSRQSKLLAEKCSIAGFSPIFRLSVAPCAGVCLRGRGKCIKSDL